jgi:anaerobic sulfatase-maturating enzyme
MGGDGTRTFAVMAKVVGGLCNLKCAYCYYTEKPGLLAQKLQRMSDDVLESYIRQNLEINGRDAVVEFAWHGGEPLLAGIAFFRKAMELEGRYGGGRKIVNTLQTNGTLLDEDWCEFFARNGFLLGVSIDGPKELHDAYRTGPEGGSFERTMAGVRLLRKRGVEFNVLATVNAANEGHPRQVYDFLRQFTDYMQFLPVVEGEAAFFELEDGQNFATPPGIKSIPLKHSMAPFSVSPEGYGAFLSGVFDRWKERDFGKKFVQIFEVTAGNMLGKPGNLCVHNPLCGHGASVEANGDVYSCDHYAFPKYRLGNILETPLADIMEKNRPFGMHKIHGLPDECFDCPYIRLCFGGCPKDRMLLSGDGQRGKNYLCEGYKIFFRHFIENMPRLQQPVRV